VQALSIYLFIFFAVLHGTIQNSVNSADDDDNDDEDALTTTKAV